MAKTVPRGENGTVWRKRDRVAKTGLRGENVGRVAKTRLRGENGRIVAKSRLRGENGRIVPKVLSATENGRIVLPQMSCAKREMPGRNFRGQNGMKKLVQ